MIEGISGTGKTTLAWQMCHKWAEEELDSLKNYDLVILIRLRKKRAQLASQLVHLLPRSKGIDMEDVTASIGVGKGVLIVCDGFNELLHEQLKNPLYQELFSGELLPEATVIVTTNPSASTDFRAICQQNLDREMEIVGFTDNGIKELASSIFSSRDDVNQFLSYIKSNYPINNMMTLPLSAVIIATIYLENIKRGTHPFPKTMSKLFEVFTKTMIHRQIGDFMEEIPCSLHNFSKLPSRVASQFPIIAEIAYDRICKNEYVFNDLGEEFDDLGLMKKIDRRKSLGAHKAQVTHAFFHHTLQEYLAALHIANKLSSQLTSLKLQLEQKDMILRFLAGMCDDSHEYGRALRHWLAQFLSQICFKRSHGTLQLIHCANECPSIMQELKVPDNAFIVVQPEVGIDWSAMGYCISNFDERWGLHAIRLRKENINLLKEGLTSPPTSVPGRLKYLHLSKSEVSVSAVVISLGKFCQLECLELLYVNIEEEDEETLKKLIAVKSGLTSLTYRTVNEYTHTRSLLPMLFGPSSLETLVVRTGSVVNMDTELLPHINTNLKKLTISRELVKPLASLLPNTSSLTHLVVASRVHDSDLPILNHIIASLPALQVLELGKIYCGSIPVPLESASSNLYELAKVAISSQLKNLKLHKKDYDCLPEYHQGNSTVCSR